MRNAACKIEYKKRFNECKAVFTNENFDGNRQYALSDNYIVYIDDYFGKVGKFNIRGSECRLFDNANNMIAKWFSVDNDGDFYKLIKHRNGNAYLIFRQDLYGYSVLDVTARKIMQFFPEESLNGNETFIWTDVEYNPINDILAVSGCFWACPCGIHLFIFESPMNESQKFVDLVACFDNGYDIYDDVEFIKWNGCDLYVTCFNIETNSKNVRVVNENEYLTWFSKK